MTSDEKKPSKKWLICSLACFLFFLVTALAKCLNYVLFYPIPGFLCLPLAAAV